jgi:2-iminobutanoate/2-iminopropanoate deaminase
MGLKKAIHMPTQIGGGRKLLLVFTAPQREHRVVSGGFFRLRRHRSAARRVMSKRLAAMAAVIIGMLFSASADAREYLKQDRAQSRGFTPAVVTEGGKIVWISGQTGLVDEQGKSMAGDFQGQARVIFRAIDAVAKRAGGSIKDVVSITVYLTDPRLIDPLMPIRKEVWPDGNFPASTTITVHSLPAVGMMLEISAVAVVGDK